MTQNLSALTPEEIINLDAYPIGDTDSPAFKTLTTRLRRELDTKQYVALPGFIRPAVRARAIAQIESVLPQANHNDGHRNCYLQRVGDPSLPADSPLKTLYYW